MTHHEFGPSQLGRYQLCPGSYRMAKGLSSPDTADSSRGTRLHEAVFDDKIYSNIDISDQEQVDYCRRLLSQWGDGYNEEMVELYDPNTHDLILFGTLDYLFYDVAKRHAVIVDFKFGYNEVQMAMENVQLAAYAAAVHQEFAAVTVDGYICQPPIKSTSLYTFTEFDAIIDNIKDIIRKAKRPEIELNPCIDACRYCPARWCCPSLRNAVDDQIKSCQNGIDVNAMSEMIGNAKLWRKAAESIESEAKQWLNNNVEIPGWTLRTRRGKFTVNNFVGLRSAMMDYMTDESFYQHASISVSSLKNNFVKIMENRGVDKSKSKEVFDSLIEQFAERTPETMYLAAFDE